MDELTTGQAAADTSGAVITIRSGAGLDAARFAADLCRMYLKYANRRHWAAGIRHSVASDGGYKDVTIHVEGPGSSDRLKYETGTHRAQRVPLAEAGGRVQTCLARVTVLPSPAHGQSSRRRGSPPEERDVKIRTYNFPHGRVTDHRLDLGAQPLARVLDGDLDALLDALENTDQ
jgi:protein subunit release factor A